jgi:hypothetical protein
MTNLRFSSVIKNLVSFQESDIHVFVAISRLLFVIQSDFINLFVVKLTKMLPRNNCPVSGVCTIMCCRVL